MKERMRHTRAAAAEASIKYFKGDELAADAFVSKYALKLNKDEYDELTPADMHLRLAREFARIEANYPNPLSVQEIFCLLGDVDVPRLADEHGGRMPEEVDVELLAEYDTGYGTVIAQGSPMSGIGDPYRIQSLSNCFVIDAPHDSYGGIFLTDEEGAQLMKRRGGVGNDVSSLRWSGAATKNAAGTSDGVTLFCERFSRTTREVAQNGRRGARMLTCDVHHPDVSAFITMKEDLKRVTGANVSVRLSDAFMSAAKAGTDFNVRFPCDSDVAVPEHVKISRWESAAPLWGQFTLSAWKSAEPGAVFWDRYLERSPADAYADLGFKTVSTNPCSEIGMCAYDSCRLIAINVYKFVADKFTSAARFMWNEFAATVRKAQRLMDDLVDLEVEAIDRILEKIATDPEPTKVKRVELELWQKIREKTLLGRRTGLGPTAIGDMLAALGIKYGSPESIRFVESVYKMLSIESYRSSCIMAGERGTFPIYDWAREENHVFLRQVREADVELDALWRKHGRRNIANTTTAPCGTVSTQTQTTSGIEPVYLLVYGRRRKLTAADIAALAAQGRKPDFIDKSGDAWQEYTVYHHAFVEWMKVTGKSDPKESPWAGATSADVDWIASVDLQAAAQRWVCHAISKTCNLPKDATVETVRAAYMRAWESGCKGFTVYRDGCRDGVLIDASADKKSEEPEVLVQTRAVKRPKSLPCDIHNAQVTIHVDPAAEGFIPREHGGDVPSRETVRYCVLVGLLGGKPYEVFCGLADQVEIPRRYKQGSLVKSRRVKGIATYDLKIDAGDKDDMLVFKNVVDLFDDPEGGAITRTISLALRHGVPVQFVVEQLQKDKHSEMSSLNRVVARILKGYIPDGTAVTAVKSCDNCGSKDLHYAEGCATCAACSSSKCG